MRLGTGSTSYQEAKPGWAAWARRGRSKVLRLLQAGSTMSPASHSSMKVVRNSRVSPLAPRALVYGINQWTFVASGRLVGVKLDHSNPARIAGSNCCRCSSLRVAYRSNHRWA